MIPAPYRTWIAVSIGLHLLLLALLGHVSFPAPRADAATAFVPVRVVEEPAPVPPAPKPRPAPKPKPKPAVVVPKPKPPESRPKPQPRPKPAAVVPRPAPRRVVHTAPKPAPARSGSPSGRRDGVAAVPGGGIHRGSGKTSPAPPAVMRTANGKGRPAPPGRPGGTGTQGTGSEPAGGPTAGPVRLGGPVPSYPKLAEDAGEEGTVVVTVSISASGAVEGASVSRSSGHPSLDAAAVRAAHSWKFKPALRNGKPVASTQSIRFHFAGGSVSGG